MFVKETAINVQGFAAGIGVAVPSRKRIAVCVGQFCKTLPLGQGNDGCGCADYKHQSPAELFEL